MSRRIIITEVEGYGWLPTVEESGKEVYRGEYQSDPQHALDRAYGYFSRVHPVFHTILMGIRGAMA